MTTSTSHSFSLAAVARRRIVARHFLSPNAHWQVRVARADPAAARDSGGDRRSGCDEQLIHTTWLQDAAPSSTAGYVVQVSTAGYDAHASRASSAS